MIINVIVPQETEHYFESSARIRGISRSALIRRTVELILRDQLFLSILDDDSQSGKKKKCKAPPAPVPAPPLESSSIVTKQIDARTWEEKIDQLRTIVAEREKAEAELDSVKTQQYV